MQHVIFNRFAGDRWVPVNEAWRRGEIDHRGAGTGAMGHGRRGRRRRSWTWWPASRWTRAFAGFVRFAAERGWEVRIASDGFDLYIEPMLAAHGLADLPVFGQPPGADQR